MFVKICGLRTAADVECAVDAGADAVGFVFSESPRQVGQGAVSRIAGEVPPEILTVGVFQAEPVATIRQVIEGAGLRAVQLHGARYGAADFAALGDLPVTLIRAFAPAASSRLRVGDLGEDVLIVDSPSAGSGRTWDWTALADSPPAGRWMLAGGLRPENVRAAIGAVRPWGVDVSSGVELVRGTKDPVRIRAFVAAARAAGPG